MYVWVFVWYNTVVLVFNNNKKKEWVDATAEYVGNRVRDLFSSNSSFRQILAFLWGLAGKPYIIIFD